MEIIPYFSLKDSLEVDQKSIETYKMDPSLLMENAGNEMGQMVLKFVKKLNKKEVWVFCGNGNNGGDGLVLSRYLIKHHITVKVLIVNEKKKLEKKKILQEKLSLLEFYTKNIHYLTKENLNHTLLIENEKETLIVDALFGTGLNRLIEGIFKEIIDWINLLKDTFIVSLDIPSGLIKTIEKGSSIKASLTITVAAYKDIFFYPWYVSYLGKIKVIPLDFPPQLLQKSLKKMKKGLYQSIATRNPYQHKLSYGKTLIIASSDRYQGAGFLSTQGCLMTGGSYVNTIGYKNINLPPQAIKESFKKDYFSKEDLVSNKILFEKSAHILIGPGLDREKETTNAIKEMFFLIKKTPKNIIIDADGLYHLKQIIHQKDWDHKHPHQILLTPHLGELIFLFDLTKKELNKDYLQYIVTFCKKHNVFLLAKEVTSLLYMECFYLYNKPNAFLGKAGSGDILSGMILGPLSYAPSFKEGILTGLCLYYKKADFINKNLGSKTPITALLENF